MLNTDLDQLITSSNFESSLAGHVHPHMYSFPQPLGERFNDVTDLVAPLAERAGEENSHRCNVSTEDDCRHYLDQIIPIFRNGYALCHGNSYSPDNSGLNIDPRTFTFKARAQDRLRYFPDKEPEEGKEEPSPTPHKPDDTRPASYPTSVRDYSASVRDYSASVRDYSASVRDYSSSGYSSREPMTGRESVMSATPTLGGESMVCNYPLSEYGDVFLREMSEESSPVPPVPPIPTGTDDFGYVKKQSVTFSIPYSHSDSGTDSTNVSVRDSLTCHPASLYPQSISSSAAPSLYPTSTNDTSSQSNEVSNEETPNEESNDSESSSELYHTQSEYNKHDRVYIPPKSALRDETWDIMKAERIRSIVVSQTWLTGWIRELYLLDDVINKRGVQHELKKEEDS